MKAIKAWGQDAELIDEDWSECSVERAMAVTQDMVAKHRGKFDAILFANGTSLLGGLPVIERERLLDKVALFAFDMEAPTNTWIEEGKVKAATGMHFIQSGLGVIVVYDYLMGNPQPQRTLWVDAALAATPTEAKALTYWWLGDRLPYSPDDVKQMSLTHNKNADIQKWLDTNYNGKTQRHVDSYLKANK